MTGDIWSALVPEEPVQLDGHTYEARRNASEPSCLPRWQVFREDMFAPVGYIDGHRCERYPEGSLLGYTYRCEPLWAGDKRGDGCIDHYEDWLRAMKMALNG
jgi:hypothetical protein